MVQMKKKVYMDTTIASYYYDNRPETEFLTRMTRNWFRNQASSYSISISEAVLVEATEGDYPNKKKVLQFVNKWRMLRFNEMLGEIVETYIQNHLMPQEFSGAICSQTFFVIAYGFLHHSCTVDDDA